MADFQTDYDKDRHAILPSYRFVLYVEGGIQVPIKAVRPFQKENEFEYIEEGGMNDYVRIKRKHATKPHTIQVERYVTDNFYDPFPSGGAEFALPLLLFVGNNHIGKVSEKSFGWSGSERVFVFFGATVMNREMGGFDAEKSGLLTETITIAYNQLYSMDVPGEGSEETWSIKDGNIKNLYASQGWMSKIAENNVKKREFVMQAEENRWMFGEDETDYLGIGTRRALDVDAKIPQNRKEKRAFETTAKKNTLHFGRDETEYQGAVGVRSYESEEKKVPKNLVEKSKLADRAAGQTWHFGASADDYKGSGPTHAQNGQIDIPQNRVEKSQLEAEAEARTYHISDGPKGEQDLATLAQQAESNTWHFGKSPEEYEGNGTMHADRMDGEPTKKDNEELIQPWPAQSYAMQMPGSKEDLLMT